MAAKTTLRLANLLSTRRTGLWRVMEVGDTDEIGRFRLEGMTDASSTRRRVV
ncbi:MAG: hypothetical protein WCJ23_06620 [Verrucomicrobiota bacterium]